MDGSDMRLEISRRGVLAGAAGLVCVGPVSVAAAKAVRLEEPVGKLGELERREGGRLGVAVLDTATGRRLEHRGNERFAMCSTFKFLLAAAILQRVDRGAERLDRRLEYGESDLLEYAPVSKQHVKDGGMSLADACAAAVELSDNTAANLLLKALGGPEHLTKFFRSLGDDITRLDNNEPALNVVKPGEEHDTTTPFSMVRLLSTVLFGQVLAPASRTRLEGWMLDAKVGGRRVPAGLPPLWRVAHKTGTGSNQTNDVGVIWPPDRAPIVVAVLYTRGEIPQERREDVLRDVGRIISTTF
jgi:beta-lactamase class A